MRSDRDIIADHAASDLGGHCLICACGWMSSETDYPAAVREHAAHVADMLRQNRTITSVNQLDALPAGAIIRDADHEGLTRTADGWECGGAFSPYPTKSIFTDGDEALVLFHPEHDGGEQ